jgi:hypothetical protein
MKTLWLRPNSQTPTVPEVSDDPQSHTKAINLLRENTEIGARRTRNLMDSYVRVSDLVALGLAQVQGADRLVTLGQDPPTMTTAMRDDLKNPQDGTIIYNSTTSQHEVRQGGAWVAITGSFPISAAEIAAGVTPVDLSYPWGWTARYSSMSHALSQLDHGGAPIVSVDGGMVLAGQVGAVGVTREAAQLILMNRTGVGSHTFLVMRNVKADDENAISFEGVDSNGSDVQHCGFFSRFVDSDDTAGSIRSVWGVHVSNSSEDWMQLGVWGNNSVRICGPAISASPEPWNQVPPRNCAEVYTYLWARSGIKAGPDLLEVSDGVGMVTGFGMEIQGNGQWGDELDGAIDNAVQVGYSAGASAGFVQAYRNSTTTYIPLNIYGSTIVLGQGNTEPDTNGTRALGSSGKPWADIWSVNALHVTSDQTLKEDAGPFSSRDETFAWTLKRMIRKYRWKSEPDGKIHIGLYAQEVEQAAREAGIDPDKLAFLSKENGRYSLIYTELILYIMAAL